MKSSFDVIQAFNQAALGCNTPETRVSFGKEGTLKSNSSWKRVIPNIFLSRSHKEANTKTVATYQKAMEAVYGKERVRRIGKLYGFDLDKMQKNGKSLTAYHLEAMQVGLVVHSTQQCVDELIAEMHDATPTERAERALSTLGFLPGRVRDLSNKDVHKLLEILNPSSLRFKTMRQRAHNFAHAFFLNFWESLAHNPFLVDEARLVNSSRVPEFSDKNFHEDAYNEMLAKELSSFITAQMPEGTIIPAPKDKDGDPQYYVVKKKVITGKGLVAIGLEPLGSAQSSDKQLPPVVIFRGSKFFPGELDCISSYIMDLEEHLTESAYESGKKECFDLIHSLHQDFGPVTVLGYSAGGAMAQQALVDNVDCCDQMIAFNSPAPRAKVAKRFKVVTEKLPHLVPQIALKYYRTKGDPVHLAGSRMVGHDCYTLPNVNVSIHYLSRNKDQPLDPTVAHSECILDREKSYHISSVNNDSRDDVENQETMDRLLRPKTRTPWETKFRRPLGKLLVPILKILRFVWRSLFGWQGNLIDEYSRIFRFVPQIPEEIGRVFHQRTQGTATAPAA